MNNVYQFTAKQYERHFTTPDEHRADGDDPTLAAYLNARLKQICVTHVMAIPGDYIAEWVTTLDDPQQNPDPALVRVHPNNEMCATYAADGYGRATGGKGVGCVAFTYGVGALNAVQAVAGATVESVPVVVINGSPSQAQFNSQRDQGVLWHHMFDGSRTDLRIFEEITEMAVRIDNPAYAADLIDAALVACVTSSRPVYIEIATTLEGYPITGGAQRLATRLAPKPVPRNKKDLDLAVDHVWDKLQSAERLVLLGGVEIARRGLQEDFARLAEALHAPYLSTLLGKGLLSEYSAPNFAGTYNGRNSQQNVRDLVEQADVILSLGVHENDFNFAGVASADAGDHSTPGVLPIESTIEARMGAVRINSALRPADVGELYWGNIQLGDLVRELLDKLEGGSLPGAPFPGLAGDVWAIPEPATFDGDAQVTWDSFKSYLHHAYLSDFDEDDVPVVLADTGLTFYNLNNIRVGANGYIAQIAWGAIGYSPAASYGVKLALDAAGQAHRRVVSVSGDGAFAESANAIGTIAELGLDNVVFVMVNGVFAIEQFLIEATAFKQPLGNPPFTALTQVRQSSLWNWTDLARGFGGVGYEVTTNAELAEVVEVLKAGSPPAPTPSGPCADHSDGSGCCDYSPGLAPPPGASTFTLVAVHNVCADLPSNTRWKIQ